MSFKKYTNIIPAGFSYLLSSVIHRPLMCGMPPAISLELTNNCNLHCPECPSGSGRMIRKRGYMDLELFRHIIKELKPYLYNMNLYFQGESMLHPKFFSFLDDSKNAGTTVSTNGHFLSEENSMRIVTSGLKKLIISLDGLTNETYSTYRINGDVNLVMEGINNVTEAKKRYRSGVRIEIQVLVNKTNESQIPDIRKFVRGTGSSLILKSMQITNMDSIESWLPADGNYRRYHVSSGAYVIKGSLPRRCARLWFNPVITWDGLVLPCCFDKDAEYIMGDLKENSFMKIWHEQKFRNFRKKVVSEREKIGICRNCTSGLPGVRT